MRLVLASASPRRRELLTSAGFSFETIVTDVDERQLPEEAPASYVRRIAAAKSARGLEMLRAAAADVTDGTSGTEPLCVLGADTAVVVDDDVLGKPVDDADARRMLSRLSGRSHLVLTGLNLRSLNLDIDGVESTEVWFERLNASEIDWYIATGEGKDKAGAYAIQGLASRFIPRIAGSYTNVVGLPVEAFWRLLRRVETGAAAVASWG